jgi:cyclopropane fatty-acyl-phospholipid synthase-like methyltransferase
VNLFYRIAYLVGFKPWDTGISPPELVTLVEGPDPMPPGKALDLGSGTGTNAIYLARHGWDVTAIDFTPSAVRAARRKAAEAGVEPRLLIGDVTKLDQVGIGGGYSLIFDLGCYHSIPVAERDGYAQGVTAAASPGATLLLFAFAPGQMRFGPTGTTRLELEAKFSAWTVEQATRGSGPGRMSTMEVYWYRLRHGGPAQRRGA